MTKRSRRAQALGLADRWLSYRAWRLSIPGVQVAVRVGGELALDAAYGVADVMTGEPLTTGHRFRVASHSKSVTALLAMTLVDEDLLRLDDELADHVEDLRRTPAGTLTLRELLSHTAGVTRDGADVAFWQLARAFPSREALLETARAGLVVRPSSVGFKYSNIGFGLVGLALEAVTGASYAALVEDRLARALALGSTSADLDERDLGPMATGHSALHSSRERTPLGSPAAAALAPATGVTSTAAELSRLLRTVCDADRSLLSARSQRWMRQQATAATARDGAEGGYGLGLMLRDIDGRTWHGHGGAWTGQATRTLVDAERDLVVSVLTNAIDGDAESLAVGVARILQHALDTGDARGAVEPESFSGTFSSPWTRVEVAALGRDLLAIPLTAADPIGSADRLEIVDPDTVRIAAASGFVADGELARVERDGRGRVERWRGAFHLERAEPIG